MFFLLNIADFQDHTDPEACFIPLENKYHIHNLLIGEIPLLYGIQTNNYVLFNERNNKITIIFLMEVLRNLLPPYININFYMKWREHSYIKSK